MKRLAKITLAVALFGGGLWSGSALLSRADSLNNANQPGSVSDPLITKSYVDEALTKLVREELAKQTGSGTSGAAEMKTVTLKHGESLLAGPGTEFIVRVGKAVAVSNSSNGIPDVTGGKDVPAGEIIGLNHLLIFPSEGRGIKHADREQVTIFVMVRGSYSKLDANGLIIN